MKLSLYSICDSKTQFTDIFVAQNEPAAVRQFGQFYHNVTLIKQNPADFNLYFLGDFDNVSGQIDALAQPLSICAATAFIERSE